MSAKEIVKLARVHVSILGAPAISAVDTSIFTLRYFRDCMNCGFCRDACCSHGVDIDLDNVAALNALSPDFEAFVGVPRDAWFTDASVHDAEFPSGRNVRTQIRDGACVFLDREARGCKIHSYCLENGIDYHVLKPMVSVLFPVMFEHGILAASAEAADGSLICTGAGPSLYDGARSELIYYFGADLIEELDRINLLSA